VVQPLALQDNLAKTPAVEKITQIDKAQPELAQRDNAIESQRKTAEQQNKPQATAKTDEVIIHREKEEKKRDEKKKGSPAEPDTDDDSPRDEGEAPEPNQDDNENNIPRKHLDIQA
jgi:hypothetical protein